jgi:glucose/arabinose dehydrogenase
MSSRCRAASKKRQAAWLRVAAFSSLFTGRRQATTVTNKSKRLCAETAFFDPGSGQDINVPAGFKVSVFASGLNMPTGIAFLKTGGTFEVYVLESGHGLPSACNEQDVMPGGTFAPNNPFTPDILVFD